MSYQKQNFANGEVLTASQLNHIENGIADVESTANATKGVVDKIIDPTLSLSGKAADAKASGISAKIAVNALNNGLNFRGAINIFDKQSVTYGKFIYYKNGELTDNADYNASDYINVEQGVEYFIKHHDQLAWYNANKEFISGQDAHATQFIAPTGAFFLRISTTNDNLDRQMVCLNPVDITTYTEYYKTANISPEKYFGTKSISYNLLNNVDYALANNTLIKKLFDPTERCNIAIYGDSITAGEGSTDVVVTDTPIPGSDKTMRYAPNCWSGMLQDYVHNHVSGARQVPINSNVITKYAPFTYNSNGTSASFNGTEYRKCIEFTYFTSSLSISYTGFTNTGKFKLFINGLDYGYIDTYRDTYGDYTYTAPLSNDGLNAHVEIYTTNEKNDNSTNAQIIINYITVSKIATATNYAISGSNLYQYTPIFTACAKETDDISIIALGTNDRHVETKEVYETYLLNLINIGLSKNPDMKFILMAQNPVASDGEGENFHMWDVNDVQKKLCERYPIVCTQVSNYNYLKKYLLETDKAISDISDDGLHPNDFGYKLMWCNICDTLGLPNFNK